MCIETEKKVFENSSLNQVATSIRKLVLKEATYNRMRNTMADQNAFTAAYS
jgi:hypothetical protein